MFDSITLPEGTPEVTRDVIMAALPEPMSEDSGPAQAYNARLAQDLPDAAERFAREYRYTCADETDPCSRILASATHTAHHITRIKRRNGSVLHVHEQDGHTPFDRESQRATLARAWSARVDVVRATALDIYRTVERYSK